MIKFSRPKTLAELEAQAAAQGVMVDKTKYDRGSDYITFSKGGCTVYWSGFTHRFFGVLPKGGSFNSDAHTNDNKAWFVALLNWFYVA